MTTDKPTKKADVKGKKLKSALRENLKKRKGQARKLKAGDEEKSFSVKLRQRDISTRESE